MIVRLRNLIGHLRNFPGKHFTIEDCEVDGEKWIVFGNRLHTTFPTHNVDAILPDRDSYIFVHLDGTEAYPLEDCIRQHRHRRIIIPKDSEAGRIITSLLAKRDRYEWKYE